MMDRLVECVPNFSEGRDAEIVRKLAETVRSIPGVFLLDEEMDRDHHRSVLTFLGGPEAVAEAAFQVTKAAARLIDLRQHDGVHPRVGATDVLPFVPIRGVTMDDCVALAKIVGKRIGEELSIPVFLYERAATRPDRAPLESVRLGGLKGLASRMEAQDWIPDFGPRLLHRTAGATIVGARPILIAYNVNLQTENLAVAKAIAKTIRSSNGGLPCLKAIGVPLASRCLTQVSMNLTNFEETSLAAAFEAVRREADKAGVRIAGSQVIGLVPRLAMIRAAERVLELEAFDQTQILEARMESVLASEAGRPDSSSARFDDTTFSVSEFLALVSGRTPTPGGGSVAALAGSLAVALGLKACRIGGPGQEVGQAKTVSRMPRGEIERRLREVGERLRILVQADAEAYAEVLQARRLPKDDPERPERMSRSLRIATDIPLETAALACETDALLRELIPQTKPSVESDVKVGLSMAKAAIEGGLESATENLKQQVNQLFIEDARSRIKTIKQNLEERKGL